MMASWLQSDLFSFVKVVEGLDYSSEFSADLTGAPFQARERTSLFWLAGMKQLDPGGIDIGN
jgi:hypothetical protein